MHVLSMRMDSKRAKPTNVNLQWTFALSKFLGVSVLHTTLFHKCYSILIQCASIPCLVIWCLNSGVFGKSLNGITKGVLHVVTTFSSTILVLSGWKQTNRALKAIDLLNEMDYNIVHTKIDKALPCIILLSFLTLICIDLEMDILTSHYLLHLENFAYYVPLIQILLVSIQFMGLVKHVHLRLDCLTRKLISTDQIDVKEFIKNYHQLYEASNSIVGVYSLQNLILIIHHVFATTFALYYFFEAVLEPYPSNTVKKRLWLSLATSMLYFSSLCLKFTLCQVVQSKAKDFKEKLYDKISSDPQEAQIITLQPILKKIKFSAFEVVDMDFKALKAIVMTIVTYQVILLQFTVSSPSTNRVHNGSSPSQ